MDTAQAEGISDDLGQWLANWDLEQYEHALRQKGIKSPNDFKYIKSKKNFQQLISRLGDAISFMDSLKLEDAWESIVPHPQKPEPQLFFLGENEKEIMNRLYQRFDDISEDVNVVQKSFNDFNQSIVRCRKQINDNTETMVTTINDKKQHLLQKIDSIDADNKKRFNEILGKLQTMKSEYSQSKESFKQIASNVDTAPKQKLQQLKTLLAVSIDDDDEKQTHNDYDHYKHIGDHCVIPGKTVVTFNEQSFNDALGSCISIACDNITSQWKLKQHYSAKESEPINTGFTFDVYEPDYIDIKENGKMITGKYGCSYSVVSTTISYNKGVHKWKIKFLKNGHRHSNPGVITDISNLKTVKRGHSQLKSSQGSKCCGYLYMWHDYDGALQGYHQGALNVNQNTGCIGKIQPNEIITIILDCDNWTIAFLRNDERVGQMALPQNQKYHPCLYTCACNIQQYQLLK